MIMKKRIGLYGGTFDPPHNGHVYAAGMFLEKMSLDRLFIMPANIPPHKRISVYDDPRLRLEMCKAAFENIDGVEVSDYEISKKGVSYTVDTLNYLSGCDREIYMLCGDDMLLSLSSWRRAEEIFSLAHIVCMRRYNTDDEKLRECAESYRKIYGADVYLIDETAVPISSTEIRERLSLGESCESFLPSAVEKYIEKHGLYGKGIGKSEE